MRIESADQSVKSPNSLSCELASSNCALHGVRILDLSSVIMGPYATQILGDQGADVIFVEALNGKGTRELGSPSYSELAGISLNLLRNKRSLCIDLKHPEGRATLLRVAASCDVVVTNLRPGPLNRLALSYDDFRAANPDIVFCQALGFPTDGDRADDPAYDDVIQSECGLADAYRRAQGSPQLCPTILADKVCGMAIANAVVIGVLHKYRTGRGQRIEVPMIDVMRAFLMIEHGAEGVSDPQGGSPGYLRILNSQRGPQKTKDGWITILPYSAEAFDAMFRAGGRHDLVGDHRSRGRGPMIHAEFLYAQLRPIVAERTTAEWMAFCREEQIPVGAVADLAEILNDYPVVQHPIFGAHRLIPSPVRFSLTPAQVRRSAPMLGEHTTEILFSAGLTAAELVDLTACGIVHCRDAETPAVACCGLTAA